MAAPGTPLPWSTQSKWKKKSAQWRFKPALFFAIGSCRFEFVQLRNCFVILSGVAKFTKWITQRSRKTSCPSTLPQTMQGVSIANWKALEVPASSLTILQLQQIPLIAVEVFENGDGAVRFFPRRFAKFDAARCHLTIITPEIIGVYKQKDTSTGLI